MIWVSSLSHAADAAVGLLSSDGQMPSKQEWKKTDMRPVWFSRAVLMAFKWSCWSDLCQGNKLLQSSALSPSISLNFTFVSLFPPPVLDQLPFMMMSHPLIPASLAPASVSMAMGQMNRLSTLASMANVAHLHAKPPTRAPTSVIKVNSEVHQLDGPDPVWHRSTWRLVACDRFYKRVVRRHP